MTTLYFDKEKREKSGMRRKKSTEIKPLFYS
jgi:hypothetical protein